ncbi:MAG: AmmeMemoRadiSam system protein B [Candidatus Woesearchaeota archaeon]
MTRKPRFAGSFYPNNSNDLNKQISECFEHKLGPGDLPVNKRTKSIKGVIAPHAGYVFSGPCAAWSFKEIGESEFPDIYIILGPDHHGSGTCISLENWDTPNGTVRVDKTFGEALLQKHKTLKVNESAHQEEHSIEVQLPFLQFVSNDKMHELKILPIIVSHDCDYKKLALDIKDLLIEQGKKSVFIVSSDFTHYGRNYHHLPFTTDIKKRIYDGDQVALDIIKKGKAEEFLKFTNDNLMTICGDMPIALFLKCIKSEKVSVEQYYTSADITESDYKNSVSYASVIFY